jgi:hypothetical protein
MRDTYGNSPRRSGSILYDDDENDDVCDDA